MVCFELYIPQRNVRVATCRRKRTIGKGWLACLLSCVRRCA